MRPRTLAVLLILAAALGGFIWFYERDLPSTDERAEQGKKLVRLDEGAVRSILLVSGERRVRLERSVGPESPGDVSAEVGEWSLTEPRQGRADQEEVEAFLERLRGLEKQRTLEDVSKDRLGLASPRAEAVFETTSGEVALRFGSQVPASSNTVIEVGEGPPFYVVSDELLEDIAREPNDWRSRDAVPFEEARIERLEFLDPANSVVLERGEEGFRLVAPIDDAADRTAVNELLRALVGLEVEEFVDEVGSGFPSAPAAVRLTVAQEEAPVLVEVARSAVGDGSLSMVRVDGEVFEAETDLATLLDRDPSQWRSREWTDLRAFEIEAFTVERRGNERESFELSEGEWKRGEEDIESKSVSAFLRAVTEARGVLVDSKPASAAAPEIEIVLDSNSGRVETLRLWADGSSYLAERLSRPALLELEVESTDAVSRALEGLGAAVDDDTPAEPE